MTGTFAGLVPVTEVDGRTIGEPDAGRPVIKRLQGQYRETVARYIAGPGQLHPRG